jgi:hypothetical protein
MKFGDEFALEMELANRRPFQRLRGGLIMAGIIFDIVLFV